MQGIVGSGMAGPSDTLGSPWLHLAMHLWVKSRILVFFAVYDSLFRVMDGVYDTIRYVYDIWRWVVKVLFY
jgi:hypothetical protein